RLDFLVQPDANVGIELGVDIDRRHFDANGRRAAAKDDKTHRHQRGSANGAPHSVSSRSYRGAVPMVGELAARYARRSSSKLREVSSVRSIGVPFGSGSGLEKAWPRNRSIS